MIELALLQLVMLFCLPVGIAHALVVFIRRRQDSAATKQFTISIALVVISLPAIWFLSQSWPLDYLGLPSGLRHEHVYANGRIELIQTPTDDFYRTELLLYSANGKSASVFLDNDDNKIWFPKFVDQGERTYILALGERLGEEVTYIDWKANQVHRGYYNDFQGFRLK